MSNGKDRVEIMNHQERLAMFQRLETGAVTDAMVQLGVGSWMEGVYPTSPKMKVFGRAVTASSQSWSRLRSQSTSSSWYLCAGRGMCWFGMFPTEGTSAEKILCTFSATVR